jgi:putative addiction module component (TIGR02574 family)
MQLDFSSIKSAAMALPTDERAQLAVTLWDSIWDSTEENGWPTDPQALAEAKRRDDERCTGKYSGRTHEQVMQAARNVLSGMCVAEH